MKSCLRILMMILMFGSPNVAQSSDSMEKKFALQFNVAKQINIRLEATKYKSRLISPQCAVQYFTEMPIWVCSFQYSPRSYIDIFSDGRALTGFHIMHPHKIIEDREIIVESMFIFSVFVLVSMGYLGDQDAANQLISNLWDQFDINQEASEHYFSWDYFLFESDLCFFKATSMLGLHRSLQQTGVRKENFQVSNLKGCPKPN